MGLKPIKPGEALNLQGSSAIARNRKMIKDAFKSKGLTAQDIEGMMSVTLCESVQQLEKLSADKSQTMIVAAFARSLLMIYKRGDIRGFMDVMRHWLGAPKQVVELDAAIISELKETKTLIDLPIEKLEQLEKEELKKLGDK